jgi:hypothetical protein
MLLTAIGSASSSIGDALQFLGEKAGGICAPTECRR